MFTFAGGNSGAATYTLTLSSGLQAAVQAGTDASLYFAAADNQVSYLFNSTNFNTASSRPLLVVSAVPEPGAFLTVIGGMTLSGMWQALGERFTKETGWPVELVVTGPKDLLSAAFRKGGVDLLTMHSSDQATNLVADGYGRNLRPWARNEQAILGPPGDPAGIRGGHDGAAALRKIAGTRSPFVDFAGPGSRDVVHGLWKAAGVQPRGEWLLKDESLTPEGILEYAAAHQAYVVVGRIPVLRGKMANSGHLEILVQGDPAMRRPYVVVEADPAKLPGANVAGARILADYLVSARCRAFLHDFAAAQAGGFPMFYHADESANVENPPTDQAATER